MTNLIYAGIGPRATITYTQPPNTHIWQMTG